jgi:hypothetical protein
MRFQFFSDSVGCLRPAQQPIGGQAGDSTSATKRGVADHDAADAIHVGICHFSWRTSTHGAFELGIREQFDCRSGHSLRRAYHLEACIADAEPVFPGQPPDTCFAAYQRELATCSWLMVRMNR